MTGNGKIHSILTTAILSLLLTLPSLFAMAGAASGASPVISVPSQQMGVDGTQSLTVTGGSGGYTWAIAGGGGNLSGTSGDAVSYQAPPTNPSCGNSPTICVADDTGQMTCMKIAVNGSTHTAPVLTQFDYSNGQCTFFNYCYDPLQCSYVGFTLTMTYIRCDGSVYGTYSENHGQNCGYYSSDEFMAIWKGLSCPANGGTRDGICDNRSEQLKAGGCCPVQMLDQASTASQTNSTGRSCPINVKTGSTTNLKSGNLFTEQDVGSLTLSYNSIDTNDEALGLKWNHNYNLRLVPSSDGSSVAFRAEDGNRITFRLSNGIYYPEAISGDTSQIVKNSDHTYTKTLKDGLVYGFDTSGRLTSITDRNGNAKTLTYNGSDIASITDSNGRTTTVGSSGGKITSITDPGGRSYNLAYTNGRLSSITDPLGNIWQYTYDTVGRMLTKRDPAGRTSTYTYDTQGRLLTATDPESQTRTMGYTQSGTTTMTEKDGGVWTYQYDPIFAVKTQMTDPIGNVTKYTYDLKRNLISVTDPDGGVTRYTYDANGNTISVTDPLNHKTNDTYNALNLVTSRTDSLGHVTQYGYDAKGNLTSITNAAGGVTGIQYDGKGNITSMTTPLNQTTVMAYDAANNLVSVTDPNGGTVTMTYDAVGNMLTQTDALNHTTTFQYNSLNQLIRITDPQGNVTVYTYDYNGNRLTATDANSKLTQYAYNFKDQLTQTIDPLSNITTLSYSGAGCSSCGTGVEKLTAVTDAKTHATTYEYDLVGNLIKETDPLGKITTYTYDGKGNLLTRTSPDNKTITYSYDLNNRLTQKQSTGGAVTTFQYDAAGNMIAAGNAAISYAMTYDANNRVTQITDSRSRTVQYQYDAGGNRTQMTTPDGRTVTYTYDNNSRLAQMATPLATFSFAYDVANRRTARTYPNGTTATYSYDAASRLLGIQTTKNATMIDAVGYSYDPTGNRLTKTTPQESWTFAYDDIYRLTQAVPTGGVHQPEIYTYDAVGNRLSSEEVQPPTGNETQNYTYDDENRLTGVQVIRNGNTRELAFAYDPFGRRIAKTIVRDEIGTACAATNVCPRTIHYVYDGESIILEYDQSGDVNARYIHGPGIDEPLAVEIRNGATYIPHYYHADGLGSITALSNSEGAVVQRYEYDSFGNLIVTTQGNIAQPYAFTGREYDSETGMYFYRARYYDPKFGRFITKDPIGFAGGDVNLYAYVAE